MLVGVVASSQAEHGQTQNKETAMNLLISKHTNQERERREREK